MKKLLIEWKHFDKEGETCSRCNETGVHIKQSIRELKTPLLKKGIEIQLRETKLTEDQMDKSNSLLFNGVPIEDVLNEVSVLRNTCNSCGDLTGNPCECRAVQTDNVTHDDIPKEIVKQAILSSIS
ncbi:MAG: hypothetical protein A2126_01160 [Candidatus Woykebacteria bacterium GWB1_45_5]|uniref:Heavy metal sensor signal transduction histidine kinase n=2 Tax=Candidatus Woykeibacteriota TaxID=1817899 RepID=A0A1G1W4H9_9BACT|nr:MAG: hypothetical protein A2113_03435 [Candidatus Woykebacteria bacterium GWA1_44_8]OGY24781.1 MAG: hypothetical protein A2126_01160 [Candidatus Woykebacteria bacterium GWB1_45_5]